MRYAIAILGVLAALLVGIKIGADPDVPVIGGIRAAIVGDGKQKAVKRRERLDLNEVRRLIERDFYREVPDGTIEDGSVQGMVRQLKDPFSHYFSPSDNAKFKESLGGSYSGVGMGVDGDERGLVVLTVYDDTPADRAGIREGDVVTAVDGKPTKGLSPDVIVARIKGKAGTPVELTVRSPVKEGSKRLGPPREERLVRQPIDLPVADGQLERKAGKPVGHIVLASFTANATDAVRKEIVELQTKCVKRYGKPRRGQQCVEGWVLDLRGDGGGRLDQAVGVASIFIEDGVIVATDGRSRKREEFEATGQAMLPDAPLVVLVNGGSASASEIVAGAVKHAGRGEVVGENTFGKGTFQEVTELTNGGALSLTLGRYYVIGKVPIGKNGIKPDIVARDRRATRNIDEALQKALAVAARERGR
jgi:carboxyl-terminal processing protease